MKNKVKIKYQFDNLSCLIVIFFRKVGSFIMIKSLTAVHIIMHISMSNLSIT